MKNKYTVIIAEDEVPLRNQLINLINSYENLELLGSFKNGKELDEFLKTNLADIAILDIDLPVENTMTVLERYKKKPKVIFITGYPEYAPDAFKIEAFDFLIKPVDEKRFEFSVKKVIKELKSKNTSTSSGESILWIRQDEKYYPVNQKALLYLEADDKYTNLYTKDENFRTCKSLNKIHKSLNADIFIKIHRKYVVNKNYIQSFEPMFHGNYSIQLKGKRIISLPVSRLYFKSIKSRFLK